jgi:glycosyltransferase involved in cell wall biosynthesis
MKIVLLQTVGGFSSSGSAGGGVHQFLGLAEEWQSLGSSVLFVKNSNDAGSSAYQSILNQRELPSLGTMGTGTRSGFVVESLANYLVQMRELRKVAREARSNFHPSVIIATSPSISDVIAGILFSRWTDSPLVIAFFHRVPSPLWEFRNRGGLARTASVWFLNRVAVVLASAARATPLYLKAEAQSTNRYWRRTRSILVDCFNPVQGPKVLPADTRPLDGVFVSRLTESKGVFDLLKSWQLVREQVEGASLVVAGEFRNQAVSTRFHAEINRLGLKGAIQVLGRIDNTQKRDLLSRAKVFPFPSYEEGWSMSVMEAASLGSIPITYDLPAYRYLGGSHVTAPIGDTRALASQIVRILRLGSQDRESLATRLRGEAFTFTRESVARAYLQALSMLPVNN